MATNLSNFQEAIADPFNRLALQHENLNNIIESMNSSRKIVRGTVVYADSQTPDAGGNLVTAIRVRAKGLHNSFVPDIPDLIKNDKVSNRIINTCMECHPVIYPKVSQVGDKTEEGQYFGASQGDIVELELNENGQLLYGRTIGFDMSYAGIVYDFTPANKNKLATWSESAAAAMSNGIKKQVGDYNINPDGTTTVTWEAKSESVQKNISPSQKSFLDKLVEELGNTGWQLKVIVTSLKRTPEEQAHVMVKNRRDDNNWWPYGKSWSYIKTIIDDTTKTPAEAKASVKDEIDKKIKEGKLVSSHLDAMAMDIRTNNIGMPNVDKKMKQLLDAVTKTGMASFRKIEYYEGKNYASQKKLRDKGGDNRPNEHLHISVKRIEGASQ
jgi:hypothetical protein